MHVRPLTRFGTPGSVDPLRLMLLPPAMQGEGVRLLLEMGLSHQAIATRLHLPPSTVDQLAAFDRPFRPGGELAESAESTADERRT